MTFSPPAWPPVPPCRPHAVPALVSARLPRAAPPGERPALEHRGRPAPWRPSPATPARQRLAQARSQGTESTDGW